MQRSPELLLSLKRQVDRQPGDFLLTGCALLHRSDYRLGEKPQAVMSRLWLGGLAAGIRTRQNLASRMDQGFWLEQAIFQSLQAWRALDPTSCRLYFWRDRSGREVDFILEKSGVLVALELNIASQVIPADVAGVKAFQQGLGAGQSFRRGAVLHGGSARRLGENLYPLPWCWLFPKAQ